MLTEKELADILEVLTERRETLEYAVEVYSNSSVIDNYPNVANELKEELQKAEYLEAIIFNELQR